ncbi:hypothetical protein ACFL46_02715 [Candidatus Neomarinimicrobiota bacterium]
MKTQRNLLLFPAIVALVYGLASVFIPRSFITYFDIPAEMITPGFVAWVVSTGIVSIGLSMLAFWMRSLTDASSMKGGMTVFSIFYALFGLETLLEPVIIPEMTLNTITVIQGIVSILLAIVFFAYREPKEETK